MPRMGQRVDVRRVCRAHFGLRANGDGDGGYDSRFTGSIGTKDHVEIWAGTDFDIRAGNRLSASFISGAIKTRTK